MATATARRRSQTPDDGGEPQAAAAAALRVPPRPTDVDRVETKTPAAQTAFFKEVLGEMANGDRRPYKEWTQLEVRISRGR